MNKIFFSGLLAFAASSAAYAQVTVSDAWVRATVAEQKATGAFLTINSKSATRLVAISSPIAKAELHEMSMQGDRMMMREVPGLDIPAGKVVELKPRQLSRHADGSQETGIRGRASTVDIGVRRQEQET